jgi:hypothetical protein
VACGLAVDIAYYIAVGTLDGMDPHTTSCCLSTSIGHSQASGHYRGELWRLQVLFSCLITVFRARGGNCHFKMKTILFFERDKTTSSERKYQFYNRRLCRSRCKLSKTHIIFNNDPSPYIIIQAYTKIKRFKTLQDMIVLDWSPNFPVFRIIKFLLI